jgi:molybdopterin/thiamine biosynthesis adenylyltransferase
MNRNVQLVFPHSLHARLVAHLFPGDFNEHGAAIGAGLAMTANGPRLLVRYVWLALEPEDYRLGSQGHMGLQATFIHRCITRCRDERLVYLAVHNHGGSGRVAFSDVDMVSHQKGYGALLDIADGLPVGALVMADNAMEVDLWFPNGERSALRESRVLGPCIDRYYANPNLKSIVEGSSECDNRYSRQVLFLGQHGQKLFKQATIAIVGLGGVGSLICEYLARLGIGHLILIDPDRLESSNASRVVGSTQDDMSVGSGTGTYKVDIAERVAREAQPSIEVEKIADDFARLPVANQILESDFIFLAADSMRARLVFNAIVHQYYIPGVQLGSKVRTEGAQGKIHSAYSVVRTVRPKEGCLLCNHLIDPAKLADEWKSDAERQDQQYGTSIPNPSVITMNAIAASHAVNDFLFSFTGIRSEEKALYRRYNHLDQSVTYEHPRQDAGCPECSFSATSRLGRGSGHFLPCAQ